MTIMGYNFELGDIAINESLRILRNQCWKLLPIFEGKNIDNQIIYSADEAYDNYQKHLTFLITKVNGASKIWMDNQYYYELAMILNGMRDFTKDEHDRVKYMVHHCTHLIEKMKGELDIDS